MADLLIELSARNPARMQTMRASFRQCCKTALDDHVWTDAATIDGLCGPRHLAVYASGIAVSQPDRVKKNGPRVDAIETRLSASWPLLSASEALTRGHPKGRFSLPASWAGADTKSLLSDVITSILVEFHGQKARDGDAAVFVGYAHCIVSISYLMVMHWLAVLILVGDALRFVRQVADTISDRLVISAF